MSVEHGAVKAPDSNYGLEAVKNDTVAVTDFLGCTPRMVAKLCETGRLRAFKVGNRWRITRDAVLEFAGLL